MSQDFTFCTSPNCRSADWTTYDARIGSDGKVALNCRHKPVNEPLAKLAFDLVRLEKKNANDSHAHAQETRKQEQAHEQKVASLTDEIGELTGKLSTQDDRLRQVSSLQEKARVAADKAKTDAVEAKAIEVRLEMEEAHGIDLKAKNDEIDRLNSRNSLLNDGWNTANARAKVCAAELEQINETLKRERVASGGAAAELQRQIEEKDDKIREMIVSETELRAEVARVKNLRDGTEDELESAREQLKEVTGELTLLKNVLKTVESPVSGHTVLEHVWYVNTYGPVPEEVRMNILRGLDPLATDPSPQEEPAPEATPADAASAPAESSTTHDVAESQIVAIEAKDQSTDVADDQGDDAVDDSDSDLSAFSVSALFGDEQTDPGSYDAQASDDDGSAADEDEGPKPCDAPGCTEAATKVAPLTNQQGAPMDINACDEHARHPEPIVKVIREGIPVHAGLTEGVLQAAFKDINTIPALPAPPPPTPFRWRPLMPDTDPPILESQYVRPLRPGEDSSENATVPAQKGGLWWKVLLAMILFAAMAGVAFYLFISDADPDGVKAAKAATKAALATNEAEASPKPDAQRDEYLRKQNDAYCATTKSDPVDAKVQEFYCATYLPESRKVDEQLRRLEERKENGDDHSHYEYWIVIGLLAAWLIGLTIRTSQKQDRPTL